VCFIKKKSEVFEKFKWSKAEEENQTNKKIRYLGSDNGIKYINSWIQKICEEHSVQ